jgi:GAF domain-containing protein
MALPMIAGGEILGVLDIQSVEANAFSDEDIHSLQLLADQLAIAVQNARLLHDSQEALMLARKATGDVSQESWKTMLQNVEGLGYISLLSGEIVPTTKGMDSNMKQTLLNGESVLSGDQKTLNMPISVRGHTIAMMRLVKSSDSEPWTFHEVEDVKQLSNQISNALESARLYNEAQRRSYFEQVIGEITTSISAATEVDDIIRETVAHLGETLQDSDVALRIKTEWN